VKRVLEQRPCRVFGSDLEARIDARFDRTLAQQVGAEGVDRPDARFLELGKSRRESIAGRGGTLRVEP